MNVLTPRAHGLFDIYVLFLLFIAPIFYDIEGEARWILWGLGAIHFLLMCATRYYYGIAKLIPMEAHGIVELLVGLALPIMPYALGFSDLPNYRHFFIGAGFAMLVFWFLTDYGYKGRAWTKGAEPAHAHDGHTHTHDLHHHHHTHDGHTHSH